MNNSIKIIALCFMFVVIQYSYAQEIKTVFKSDSSTSYGGYGAPYIDFFKLKDLEGVFVGGKGGVLINQKYVIGLFGHGYAGNKNFKGDDLNGNLNADLQASFSYGGLYFEYIPNLIKPLHFAFPINFGLGELSVKEKNTDTSDIKYKNIESSNVIIIQPSVNLEFNLTQIFIVGVNVNYRHSLLQSTLKNFENSDVSGMGVGLVFKFGYFGASSEKYKK